MPSRDWRLRIADILDAIATIREFTAGMDYDAFVRDRKTVDAVLRNFTIIGEAARHVPDEVTVAHPEIPWQDMRDMRNVIMHAYFGVNLLIIWDTIQGNLPPLIKPLEELLQRTGR